MEIVFVNISNSYGGRFYPGILDAVRLAEKRSGCRVTVISDREVPCRNFLWLETCWKSAADFLQSLSLNEQHNWTALSLCRWLVLLDYVKQRGGVNWPILALDNDVMVFSNMEQAYAPLVPFDFCTFLTTASIPAPYSMHNLACLEGMAETILRMAKEPRTKPLDDMDVGQEMVRSGKWNVGDLTPIREAGAFDDSMHAGENRFVMEPSHTELHWGNYTKRITWFKKSPYFTLLNGDMDVKAHWIHCWGSYKTRTTELLKKAGL